MQSKYLLMGWNGKRNGDSQKVESNYVVDLLAKIVIKFMMLNLNSPTTLPLPPSLSPQHKLNKPQFRLGELDKFQFPICHAHLIAESVITIKLKNADSGI